MIPKLPRITPLVSGLVSGAVTGGAPLVATALQGLLEPTEEPATTIIAKGGNGLAPIVVSTAALKSVRKMRVSARRKAGIIQPAYVAPAMPRMTRARRGR